MELIYSYTLTNAWGSPLHDIKIYEDPSGSFAEYFVSEDGKGGYFFEFDDSSRKKVMIPDELIGKIHEILDNDRLFETEELEKPHNVIIMDGFVQRFEIHSKDRYINASGANINECGEDMEHCPHSVLMIQTLKKICKILIPLGVPKECFAV